MIFSAKDKGILLIVVEKKMFMKLKKKKMFMKLKKLYIKRYYIAYHD